MAILNNPLYRDYHGQIDKRVVIKQYATKTVMTAYPDMSKVTWSAGQIRERSRFKQAVAYAQSIIADPAQKAAYQATLTRGKRVFNAAIAEFMQKPVAEMKQEKTVWIADAFGRRPLVYEFQSPNGFERPVMAGIRRPRRGLIRSKVVPRSVKRPFERRITELEVDHTLRRCANFYTNYGVKPVISSYPPRDRPT